MPRKNNRKKNRSKKQDEQDILVKSGDLFDSDTTPKSHVLIRYPKPTSLDDDAKYFAAVRGFVIPEKYEGFEEAKADYIEEMRIDDESVSFFLV